MLLSNFIFISSHSVYSYIDPGTGSYFPQIRITALFGEPRKIYNICSWVGWTIEEVANHLLTFAGLGQQVKMGSVKGKVQGIVMWAIQD